ncbi:MAG: NAD-dependent epimerase/dehydratase family protein, partial [Armatimonadetes bacterium]|nr:NAD-dependent epimerase/dehydratase family protein [Armatimonadota bacterium]NIM24679.1 NAD-dependent epimerase/dehydratase family protein [Armatimonadota bacterium]NIM68558.1 NAD-dependent epimerase/dehydratase family protein [Armatimonadota bacterium]NIM76938.1 NAD-dependent epimerase/dehydratase family protein [Armatimonadota bacterium]NIN06752.1 NAD-dependent epimerase/dehydratase family protein [Armatimonadota bacterium]
GHEVAGVDDMSGGFRRNVNPAMDFHVADLRDRSAAAAVVEKTRPEILCHLAANAREGASQFQPLDVTDRNLLAYINTLIPCIKMGLKKVILFSSMAMYGEQEPPFDESMPRLPADIYGVNKAAMEQTTEILADVHEFQYTIIRPHNVFGERQSIRDKYRNVIGIFMNSIMRDEAPFIYGDGEQERAFSYIHDCLPSFARAAELRPELHREAINVGGMHPITINRVAELVCQHFEGAPEPVHIEDRPREVKHAWCTWEKSVRLLGYEEPIGIEEGIRRTA